MVAASAVFLGFQKIDRWGFERGGDTLLGLELGLDLQGGSHLVYQAIDTETREPIVPEEGQMDALKRSIEKRVNSTGLGEPIIQILGDERNRLLVQLPGVSDPERAKRIIGDTAQLVFKHRTLNIPRELPEGITDQDIVSITAGTLPQEGEGSPAAEGTPAAEAKPEESGAQAEATGEPGQPQEGPASVSDAAPEGGQSVAQPSFETMSPEEAAKAVAEAAGGEPSEQTEGPPIMIVEFTELGAAKFALVMERLSSTLLESFVSQGPPPNRLEISVEGDQLLRLEENFLSIRQINSTRFGFAFTGQPEDATVAEAQALLGDNPTIHFTEIQGKVDEQPREGALTGDDLARAYPSQHSGSGAPIVNLEFNSRGSKIFGELTERIAGSPTDQIAIFLDDEELLSPQVTSAITSGSAIIQGRDFTVEGVRDLANLLEEGSLPLTIDLIQERDVDAILGADSLKKSVVAGLVGLGLVLMFMTFYYRASGVVASLALLMYAVLILGIFKLLPVTLTLSGVAAIILSVGMAVDANVLIFERMKEELRAGRTLLSAINIGFNRAWPAIRDGNVSTLITCGILFYFSSRLGTTVVQGFAVTLAIGVLVSMFSAITISRTLLRVMATTGLARKLGLFVPTGGGELPQLREGQVPSAAQRS